MSDLLACLPSLSREQLQIVYNQAAVLLGSAAPAVEELPDEQTVFETVRKVLLARGDESIPVYGAARKAKHWGQFQSSVKRVTVYVDRYFRPKTKIERAKILHMIVTMAAKHLERKNVDVCWRTLRGELANVAAVVDNAFPGYRHAGILPLVVRKYKMTA